MRAQLFWTPRARKDSIDIFLTIGIENPPAAERVRAALIARVELLKQSPRLGVRRQDIGDRVRMLIEGAYLVLYETEPDTDHGPIDSVVIVRILHGRRDVRALFAE